MWKDLLFHQKNTFPKKKRLTYKIEHLQDRRKKLTWVPKYAKVKNLIPKNFRWFEVIRLWFPANQVDKEYTNL